MIQIATINQAPAIESLMQVSFEEIKDVYTPDAYKATVIKQDEIIRRMSEGPLWIASVDKLIVGTVAAFLTENSLYIRGMAVNPQSRGQRIGEKLLMAAENFAVSKNINRLFLGTTSFLSSAIRLYDRKGFKQYDIIDFYGMDLFMMEKFLK
jgi:GNAT superfamily N-acetyltransferase